MSTVGAGKKVYAGSRAITERPPRLSRCRTGDPTGTMSGIGGRQDICIADSMVRGSDLVVVASMV